MPSIDTNPKSTPASLPQLFFHPLCAADSQDENFCFNYSIAPPNLLLCSTTNHSKPSICRPDSARPESTAATSRPVRVVLASTESIPVVVVWPVVSITSTSIEPNTTLCCRSNASTRMLILLLLQPNQHRQVPSRLLRKGWYALLPQAAEPLLQAHCQRTYSISHRRQVSNIPLTWQFTARQALEPGPRGDP